MNLLDLARSALASNDSEAAPMARDPESERRKARALRMLAEEPDRRIAVVAEAGKPVAHVVVAVRGVAVGELEIDADKYDAFALMALMQQHGHA